MRDDMNHQSDKRNISMVMDFYEMTMANGYFNSNVLDTKAVFDVFYRDNPDQAGFSIFAGLEQIIDYIKEMHFEKEDIDYLRSQKLFPEDFLKYLENYRFRGTIYAMPEGTIMYPYEPILTVIAPMIDAQLIETAILLEINHQSLIATKTSRIVRAAAGKAVSDFGARRAHNVDAAVYGARAAYIGGAVGTATVLAGQQFGIPISGTMAHSFVTSYGTMHLAANAVASNVTNFVVILCSAYGLALTTIVGQCMGAGEKKQARDNILKMAGLCWASMLVLCAAMFLLRYPIAGLYHLEGPTQELTAQLLTVSSIGAAIFWTLSFIPAYGLRAAGDVKYIMWAGIISMWVCRVALAYLFGTVLGLGSVGILLGMTVDWACRGVLFTVRFFRGRWMEKKVV